MSYRSVTFRAIKRLKGGIALTGVTVLAHHAASAARPPTRPAAGPPARQQRYRRRQMIDDSEQNSTGRLGGPVISEVFNRLHCSWVVH